MKKKRFNPNDYLEQAVEDPDNPPLTDEQLSRMRPLSEMDPEFIEAIKQLRKRGRPPLETPKVQVTIRLDEEVLNSFKEDGPGWQGRINEELRKKVKRRKKK